VHFALVRNSEALFDTATYSTCSIIMFLVFCSNASTTTTTTALLLPAQLAASLSTLLTRQPPPLLWHSNKSTGNPSADVRHIRRTGFLVGRGDSGLAMVARELLSGTVAVAVAVCTNSCSNTVDIDTVLSITLVANST
jgi:hypothetical protein